MSLTLMRHRTDVGFRQISDANYFHVTETETHIEYLLKDLTTLSGVGEKLAERLSLLIGGRRLIDLVSHLPTRWANRSRVADISLLETDHIQTVVGEVQHFSPAPRGSKLQRIRLSDPTGFVTLVFFNGNAGYLKKQFPIGQTVAVSGLVEDFHGQRQITHPDYVVPLEQLDTIPAIEPIYPLQAGTTNKRLHGLIMSTLDDLPDFSEWITASLVKQRNWPTFEAALRLLHNPADLNETELELARERLAYDEALARALTFRLQRAMEARDDAPGMQTSATFMSEFRNSLPFDPTGAQTRAMTEVSADMGKTAPMKRMLQGDVGSGKTTVAGFAAALAIRNGFQVAVMAPTEVLARQLYTSLSSFVEPLGMSTACLVGGMRAKEKRETQEKVASGDIQLICGTHALFQDKISFSKLGLVIIDEQHRFGVADRARLADKGLAPHLLIMSATPIPRSLAMTIHGDVDLSVLDEKPAGRQPVETRIIPDARLDEIVAAVGRAIERGEQVFWVCPRVEDDDDGPSAVARHAMLSDIYQKPVGLVHGRLSSEEKTGALETFRMGQSSVLVATTVIEVGVDVPGATIMVIEGAERFGLAQLHQLRGRVGRGNQKSFCILLYSPPLGVTAKRRLETLRESEDGFHIAEVDFELRGPGDILGLEQSGVPNFRFLDLTRHQGLLAVSQKEAATLQLEGESDLTPPQQQLMRLLATHSDRGPRL